MSNNSFPITALVLACGVFVAWSGTRFYMNIRFEQDTGGHLKLAADANSGVLAEQQLDIALNSLDSKRVCDEPGFTSLVYQTPDEDVGYWCTNLRATHDDLLSLLNNGGSDLTESNMLIKVRETLLDHGQSGDSVTAPQGIAVYPHNGAFAWWGFLSFIGGIGAAHIAARSIDY